MGGQDWGEVSRSWAVALHRIGRKGGRDSEREGGSLGHCRASFHASAVLLMHSFIALS